MDSCWASEDGVSMVSTGETGGNSGLTDDVFRIMQRQVFTKLSVCRAMCSKDGSWTCRVRPNYGGK